MRRIIFGSVMCLSLALGSSACDNNPTYMKGTRTLETQAADDGTITPDSELFIIPVRKPNNDEKKKLAALEKERGLMMPLPWVTRDDLQIEVQYSVKNLDSVAVTANVKLDGGNEFGDYQPGLYVDLSQAPEQRTTPPSLAGGTPFVLQPNQSVSGIFREDQTYEAGIDIEAITRYPDMAEILNQPFIVLVRRSYVDKTGLQNIPAHDEIPAQTRLLIQIESSGHVALDYIVRVRPSSDKDLLRDIKAPNLYVPKDPMLPPPVAPVPFVTPPPTPAPGQ